MSISDRLTEALSDRYRIERELGAGGMAVVFLAEDVKHHRKVAVKVLRPELAAVVGAERFLAEIETTANLQHPHILPLYDSGEADTFLFYVMPYVEGESLREKLDRERQLPIEEAVRIATAVASALDYAHRQGVVHRDIKPANILLHDGEPMVADFGIALAVQEAGGGRLTETGLSLGTPYYMSPEQATADRDPGPRSDVYSLGCVLYEMLTGEAPFTGGTAQAVLGKILTAQPTRPTEVRSTVPPHVEAALLKALQKLPADRFTSAADFAKALGDATAVELPKSLAGSGAGAATRRGRLASLAPWAITATALIALLVTWGTAAFRGGRATEPRPAVRAALELPPDASLDDVGLDLSSDGSFLVVEAIRDGRPLLMGRRLDELDFRPIPGTEHGTAPTISPDGRQLALRQAGELRRLPIVGGPAVAIDADAAWGGPAWSADGTVIYSRSYRSGLWRTRIEGGEPEPLTEVAEGELAHWWPQLLPGGEHVIFTVFRTPIERAAIAVLSLASGEVTEVVRGGVHGRYVRTGHILFVRGEALHAAPFDPATLEVTGEAVLVVDDVAMGHDEGLGGYDVSDTGVLVYLPASDFNAPAELVRVRRDGTETPVLPEAGQYASPRLSPDGDRIALAIAESGEAGDVWVLDLRRGTRTRITSGGGADFNPLWSADGRRVVFVSEEPVFDLHIRPADASAPETPVVTSGFDKYPRGITPDGDTLLYQANLMSGQVIRKIPLDGSGEPEVVYAPADGDALSPALSPGGEWLAYVSDASGEDQVYVSPYAAPESRRLQVSVEGGGEPLWTRGGAEIVYRDGGRVLAVAFDPATGELGAPTLLFEGPYLLFNNPNSWDVSPDGESFLMVRRDPEDAPRRIVVVTDFFSELTRTPNDR